MNRYEIKESDGHMSRLEGENMTRDGEWVLITKSVPLMETRTVNHPEQAGTADQPYRPARTEVIQVSTGRLAQQTIAAFYKPVSAKLLDADIHKEPSDGNDA